MTRTALALLMMLLTWTSLPALATDGFYLEGRAGVAIPEESKFPNTNANLTYDPGVAVDLAWGYAFSNGFRADLSAGFLRNDLDEINASPSNPGYGLDGEFWTATGIVTMYYDLRPSDYGAGDAVSGLALFGGIGAGFAYVNLTSSDLNDDDDTVFAYRLTGGASYDVADHWTLTLQYQYLGTDDPELKNTDIQFASHQVLGGVRYRFSTAAP